MSCVRKRTELSRRVSENLATVMAYAPTRQSSTVPLLERPESGHAFRLLRYFSITGGIAILLAAFVFSWNFYAKEVDDQVGAAEARNVVLAQAFANAIWPQFGAHLLGRLGDANQIREDANTGRLRDKLASMSHRVPVTKIKIYNASGIAVYSSDPLEIGEDDSGNPAFKLALTGKAVSKLTRRGELSSSEQTIEPADRVSTYIPIAGSKDQVHAVFELYSDVTETLLRVRQLTLRVLFGLLSIFAVLYAVLLLVVASADRILQRQYSELKENEGQIQAKNHALEFEIEARRTVEAALRASEEAAGSANRAKSEFLSNMSHELRTPMNAILGFAQLLKSEPGTPLGATQRTFVDQILKAGRHLLLLINEVLDLARIEAGKFALSIEAVSVAGVLAECLPLIQNMARDMDVAIEGLAELRPDGTPLRVMADYMRLKQVLLNLLSNAVKYNRKGGSVSLSATAIGADRVRISVGDTGVGIPESMQGDIFRPFLRLVPESSGVEGTGIGLALARNLVRAMGGEIGFASVAGAGSTFWVEFALAPGAPPAVHTADADAVSPSGDGQAGGSVLYIEDNPANVMLMEHIARRMSIRFMTAHNAELGIALAVAHRPDLVIMDINLPQMDGYEALACLMKNPATAAIPVIALSANAMPRDVERGLAAGFARYHTKPIDVDEIATSVGQMLAARR
jgi:signal transduction histidine kinase